MNDINLALKIEDINLVLSALSNLPFIQVHELIGKIQVQAAAQLTAAGGARASMQLENN